MSCLYIAGISWPCPLLSHARAVRIWRSHVGCGAPCPHCRRTSKACVKNANTQSFFELIGSRRGRLSVFQCCASHQRPHQTAHCAIAIPVAGATLSRSLHCFTSRIVPVPILHLLNNKYTFSFERACDTNDGSPSLHIRERRVASRWERAHHFQYYSVSHSHTFSSWSLLRIAGVEISMYVPNERIVEQQKPECDRRRATDTHTHTCGTTHFWTFPR